MPGIWPNKWTIRFLVAVLCSWPSIVGLTRGDALSYYLSWSGLLFQLAGLCVAVVGIYKLMRAFDRWFRNILFPMITVSASLSMPYNAVSDLVFEVSPVDSSLDDRVSRLEANEQWLKEQLTIHRRRFEVIGQRNEKEGNDRRADVQTLQIAAMGSTDIAFVSIVWLIIGILLDHIAIFINSWK